MSMGVAVIQVSMGVAVIQVSMGVAVIQVSMGVAVIQVSMGVAVIQVSIGVATTYKGVHQLLPIVLVLERQVVQRFHNHLAALQIPSDVW